jgi:peptidoglycan/LPS O-acetylase OafA/YrhL
VYLGLTDFRRAWFLEGADYSYGLFLYHWVVQQAVMDVLPRHWVLNLVVSIPLAIVFAAASWRWIEKPAMALRIPLMTADKVGYGRALSICGIVAASVGTFAVYHRWSDLIFR